MNELNKYTLQELINLPDDERKQYQAFGLALKADDWSYPDILEWEWAKVKQLQDLLNKKEVTYNEMIDAVMLVHEVKKERVLRMTWDKLFPFYNFLVKCVERINELEKVLAYDPDGKEVNAGIEEYTSFGWFVTLDRLANGDPTKYEAIGKQDFATIYAKLKLNKLDAEYQKRLTKNNRDV